MATNERLKRERRDYGGKAEAFKKLKKLKTSGTKNKCEVEPIESVYEVVTEKEYADRVLKRQKDDWIIDDDGADGYVEDGREIFDDDITEDFTKEVKSSKHKARRVANNNLKADGGIKKMFLNISGKKKSEVNVNDDDILGNLINQLDSIDGKENYANNCNKPLTIDSSAYTKTNIDYHEKLGCDSSVCTKNNTDYENPRFDSTIPCEKNIIADLGKPSFDLSDGKKHVLEFSEVIIDDAAWGDDFSENDIAVSENMEGVAPITNSTMPNSNIKIQKCGPEQVITVSNADKEILESNLLNDEMLTDFEVTDVVEDDIVPEEENNSQSFRFFYWDVYEDTINRTGMVFLFGKTWDKSSKSYVSCCVVVKNIERRVFILPKEETPLLNVYKEFNEEIATKFKIMEFKSKKVKKQYVFDLPFIPEESEYLEIRYSASYPALPSDLKGSTFNHVFGTKTSFLEYLLLEKAIKGPCWLEITSPESVANNLSWCKSEVICSNIENIKLVQGASPPPPPPLVIAVLNVYTTVLPKSNNNCILMINALIRNNYRIDKDQPLNCSSQFCAFTRPPDVPWPYDLKETLSKQINSSCKLEKMDTERALLSYFVAKICQIDPDVIVGHGIHGFDISVLIHRLIDNKINQWSRIGRLRRNQIPPSGKNSNFLERTIMCGRLLCDTKVMAKELINSRSYDLKHLYKMMLNTNKDGVDGDDNVDEGDSMITAEDVRNIFSNTKSLMNFIRMKNQETVCTIKIMINLNMLPLSVQITNIAGNVLSKTLLGGRSERNEFLLLHAFYSKNYIVPDKHFLSRSDKKVAAEGGVETSKTNQKAQYEGGLVLEPKRGYYDKMILLLDFNSLYPSIIQEYNICFTTIPLKVLSSVEGKEGALLSKSTSLAPGILPTEIRKLVESRGEVKKLLQKSDISAEMKHKYNIRQLALKLTANSMYGCLGFSQSRFYAKPLAALVTAKGREILMNTRDLVQKLNYDVIYGDTDSIMINTNSLDYDDVYKIGFKIKNEVNKLYKKIELDIDAVFKYMLLLKKKKYAAISVKKIPNGSIISKKEIKGLDIIRRDWSVITSEVGRYVVSQILSDYGIDEKIENIYNRLKEIKKSLESNEVPLTKLTITKQLTKNPNEYPDAKNLPHVQVALRLNSTISKQLRRGDTVSYVICQDGSNSSAIKRAYHIDEIKGRTDLKVDVDYYLSQQIYPVVSRLCEPIAGIDAAEIGQCLGLTISVYNQNRQIEADGNDQAEGTNGFEDKYINCDRFSFNCINPKCVTRIEIDIPALKDDKVINMFDHYTANECTTSLADNLPHIQNTLSLSVRSYVQKYYRSRTICEDSACAKTTKRLSLVSRNGISICRHCNKSILTKTYTESELYHQLSYFETIFDLPQILQTFKTLKIHHQSELFLAYAKLKELADKCVRCSAYNYINLQDFNFALRNMRANKI